MSINGINIILYTDIGDDIDDTLALWFTNKTTAIQSMIVILSSDDSNKRLQTRQEVAPHLTTSYTMIVWDSASCDSELQSQIQADTEYTILCIWPTTECARHIKQHIIPHKQINSLTIQAWITPNNNTTDAWRRLNQESRNLKTDIQAAQFFDSSFLTYNIPINWIGKHAAYEIWLSKQRFRQLAIQEKDFGEYIEKQAYDWQKFFALHNASKYAEIYWENSNILSFPYDLIALISIIYPDYINWEMYDCYKVTWYKPWKRLKEEVFWLLGSERN